VRANIQQIAGCVSVVHAQAQCWAAGREQCTSWSNPRADVVHVPPSNLAGNLPCYPVTASLSLAALSWFQASGSLNMGATSPQAFWGFPQPLGWAPGYYHLVVPDLRYNYLQKQDEERDGPVFELTGRSSSEPTGHWEGRTPFDRPTYLIMQMRGTQGSGRGHGEKKISRFGPFAKLRQFPFFL